MEGHLKEKNIELPVKDETPIQTSYQPEVYLSLELKDETPIQTSYQPEVYISLELKSEDGIYYQLIIGILRWMVELGMIYICLEVYMMLSHLALLQEGNMEKLYNVFEYLKKYHNYYLVINPSDQVIDQYEFERQYCTSSDFGHVSGKEDITSNMPDTHGLGFVVTARVDAEHDVDTATLRSRTGFIIHMDSAPVY